MTIPLDRLNAHGAVQIGETIIAYVRDAVSVISNSVQAKQSQLSIPVEAGATYQFEAWIPFALDGASSGYKFTPTGPAMTFVQRSDYVINGTSSAVFSYSQGASFHSISGALSDTGSHEAVARGIFSPSASGEFYIAFSQFVSDTGAITLSKGAYLKVTRIG